MPLFAKGCYAKCNEDYPYEVETTYQLKYYISSALISMGYDILFNGGKCSVNVTYKLIKIIVYDGNLNY